MSAELHEIPAPAQSPARLRELLVSLGPPFIKLGQYLALRPDLIRADYCDELLHLADHAPSFDWSAARRIIEEDLGGSIESLFEHIEKIPVAAASLAQVHRARTRDGTLVAVKVQRPNAAEDSRRAFRRERVLKRILSVTDASAAVPVADVLAELRRWIAIELDMIVELSNLQHLHELISRAPGIQKVPRPFPALCGRRVVTAEFFTGVPFSELLQLARRADGHAAIARLDLDVDRLAENLIEAIFTQIFRFQFFHADPHPGNLIALPGDVVGFVDLALADSLSPSYRRLTSEYLTALYEDDVDGMTRSMLEVLAHDERSDIDGFRREMAAQTAVWMRERERAGIDAGGNSPLRRYMVEVVAIARRKGLRMPVGLLSMYRALLTAETVAERLGSRADLSSVGERFFRRYRCDQAIASVDADHVMAMGLDVLNLVRSGPGQLHRLLSDLADDKLVLSVRTQASPADQDAAATRVKLLSLGGTAIAVALLLVGGASFTVADVPISVALWPLLGVLYLWMVVLWRRL